MKGKTVRFYVMVTLLRNCRLCNQIEQVCTSVLTCCTQKGNPVGMDTNTGIRNVECAPCAGSNLTLKEKLMSLDDMELVEENKDNSPCTDDEESLA
jgi:hypothetical protein